MNKYRHREDCFIERNDPRYPASAVLYDCDGDVVRRFDEDWTDNQISAALEFANHAYHVGFNNGKSEKAREIKSSLGIPL
jgi:hypothetical protein